MAQSSFGNSVSNNGGVLCQSPQADAHPDTALTRSRPPVDAGNSPDHNQPRISSSGRSLLSPRAIPGQDTTPSSALSSSQSQSQAGAKAKSTDLSQEINQMCAQGAGATEETEIDASLLLCLVDPPRLPTSGETAGGLHQGPIVAPLPSSGFGRYAGSGSGFGIGSGTGFGVPSVTFGPPPNAPTGPRSTRTGFQKSSLSAHPASSSPSGLPQPSRQSGAKRSLDHLISRSPSPPHVRIKLQAEASPEPDISRRIARSQTNAKSASKEKAPRINSVNAKLAKPMSTFMRDPNDKRTGWQVLCLTLQFMRRAICGYLGFSDTSQMRKWEVSDLQRWEYTKTLTTEYDLKVKVLITDVMRIICNSGGLAAEVLEYIETLEPWTLCSNENIDFTRNATKVALTRQPAVGSSYAVLRVASAIVWLIRSSPVPFPESGRFDTPYFWYAPEDVNRAFHYLNNLRFYPDDRQMEDLQPIKLEKQIKKGEGVGLASLHNSVSEGEWAGRFLRRDITVQQKNNTDQQKDKPAEVDNKPAEPDNKADNQGNDMRAQLVRLRTWSYNTHLFTTTASETELDRLMTLARLHTNPLNRNMDGYRVACMNVEVFVWTMAHPGLLHDKVKDMFADFKVLVAWLRGRGMAVGDDGGGGVARVLEDAVRAVADGDRGVYHGKKAVVKEMVFGAEFGGVVVGAGF
jgi:hypothetical protein